LQQTWHSSEGGGVILQHARIAMLEHLVIAAADLAFF